MMLPFEVIVEQVSGAETADTVLLLSLYSSFVAKAENCSFLLAQGEDFSGTDTLQPLSRSRNMANVGVVAAA